MALRELNLHHSDFGIHVNSTFICNFTTLQLQFSQRSTIFVLFCYNSFLLVPWIRIRYNYNNMHFFHSHSSPEMRCSIWLRAKKLKQSMDNRESSTFPSDQLWFCQIARLLKKRLEDAASRKNETRTLHPQNIHDDWNFRLERRRRSFPFAGWELWSKSMG